MAAIPAAGAAQAPPAPPPAPDLTAEVAGLRQSVEELVALLRDYRADQQLELLMKRLELAGTQLVPVRQELAKVRGEKDLAAQEVERLETLRETFEQQRGDDEENEERWAMMLEQFEGQLRAAKDKVFALEQRQLTLEAEMAEERQKVDLLEDLIDRELGLR
ncbi:MAG: hypothetical protein D6696_20535 [Acidobacteria bacterium]|nr:MAG: hypothetical protein D6696_20535 [Acidobacteriota bacterium]